MKGEMLSLGFARLQFLGRPAEPLHEQKDDACDNQHSEGKNWRGSSEKAPSRSVRLPHEIAENGARFPCKGKGRLVPRSIVVPSEPSFVQQVLPAEVVKEVAVQETDAGMQGLI